MLAGIGVGAQGGARRVAFVIANARYANEGQLQNPHNDARLIADVLRRDLRFDEVAERRDLGRAEMYDLVSTLVRRARGADAVVVYYSGHGMRGPGGNYLIPVDARISEEEHVRRDALPVSELVDALQGSGARVALLILDACRDSPYARRTRSLTKGLARMNIAGGNLLVTYATADGQVAEDGSGSNSPYALALAQHLRDVGKPVMKQFDLVRASTRQATGNRQNPTREGDLEVDVMLIDPRAPAAVAIAPAAAPAPMAPPATALPPMREPPAPAPPPVSATSDADPIVVRIGHVGPTSGAIAHLGRDNELGASLAVEDLNRRQIVIGGRRARFELVTGDDVHDPTTAIEVARRMVAERVSAVVGHLGSGTSIPASRVYAEAGVPQITPSATNPKFTRRGLATTFRVVADEVAMGATLGRFAVQSAQARTIVTIDDRTSFGQRIAEEFEKGVKQAGGAIAAREYTNDKATDFASIIGRLAAVKPDLVFFGGMDAVAGPLMRQLRQYGVNARFFGGDGICTGELPKLAAGAMLDNQVVCAESGGVLAAERKGMDEFYTRFKQRFNREVQIYAPYTYDAVMVIADAMVRARSSAPDRVLQALRSTHYTGVTGTIRFDSKGDIVQGSLTLYTYVGGRRSQLSVVKAPA